jgi:hypothetical protein
MTEAAASEWSPQTRVAAPWFWLASPATATGLAVFVLLLAVAVVPLTLVAHQGVLSNVGQVVTFLPIAAAGFVVARHRSRNPIGWLLIAAAAGALLTDDAGLYVWLVYRLGYHLPLGPAALLLAFTWFTMYLTLPLAILLFPDGMLPSPRWRWVLWAYLAVTGFLVVSVYAAVVGLIMASDVRIDASGGLAALDTSSGGTAWLSPVHMVILPILAVFWLSFVARLLLSWRRASIMRRQQLKWLLTGCAISLATGIISVTAGLVPHASAAVQGAASFISDLGFVVLAVCVGVATRPRSHARPDRAEALAVTVPGVVHCDWKGEGRSHQHPARYGRGRGDPAARAGVQGAVTGSRQRPGRGPAVGARAAGAVGAVDVTCERAERAVGCLSKRTSYLDLGHQVGWVVA